MSEHPDDLLTTAEVAQILRMGEKAVKVLFAEGAIPARKKYRWTALRSDVLAYHRKHVTEPRPNKRRGRGRRAA